MYEVPYEVQKPPSLLDVNSIETQIAKTTEEECLVMRQGLCVLKITITAKYANHQTN